jgi:hypothetical protein
MSKNNRDSFDREGFAIQGDALFGNDLKNVQNELIRLSHKIDNGVTSHDLQDCWSYFKKNDRSKGGSLYNGFKFLPAVQKLASSDAVITTLKTVCGLDFPALIDINCRIDSSGEEKFLFDWHQDYWFSVSSPNAVVVWIPVVALTPDLGGLEVISNTHTSGKIFNTKKGEVYNSYADAVALDDNIPSQHAVTINELSEGDCLLFKFNVLHKSIKVTSMTQSRFTVQLRYADYGDGEFLRNKFKPGVVTPAQVDYLKKGTV